MIAFTRHALASAVAAGVLVMSSASPASAQNIGTFPFALQPFCNTVVLSVTQDGSTYRLAGWDDACGATLRQPVYGTIAPNADGTLNISFTNVRPTGIGVETSIRNFNLGSFTGNWTDSAGNSGIAGIVGLSGTVGSGGARPGPSSTLLANSVNSVNIVNGSVEAVDVNPAQIQLRVGGACAQGSYIRSIDANGAVVCGVGPFTETVENVVSNGLTTTCEQLAALPLTVPAAGDLHCEAVVNASLNHTNGIDPSRLSVEIELTSAACAGTPSAGAFEIPAQLGSYVGQDASVPVRQKFAAVTAGATTVYLNGRLWNLTTGTELAHSLSCTFTPQ